jgi:hypothetical protein
MAVITDTVAQLDDNHPTNKKDAGEDSTFHHVVLLP